MADITKCIICSTVVKDESELSAHYHDHHPAIIFACYDCPNFLKKLDELNLHLDQAHAITSPEKGKIAIYDIKFVRIGYLDGELCEQLPSNKRKRKCHLGGSQRCVVDGCETTRYTPDSKLFRFPYRNLHQRYLWVALVNKKPSEDGEAWVAKPWHRICSLHFKGGNYSRNQKDVNFIPTLFADSIEDGPTFEMPATPVSTVLIKIEKNSSNVCKLP